jgi:hypothetical protein
VTQQAPIELGKARFWAIMAALMVSVFLFALGRLISPFSLGGADDFRPTDRGHCYPQDHGGVQFID